MKDIYGVLLLTRSNISYTCFVCSVRSVAEKTEQVGRALSHWAKSYLMQFPLVQSFQSEILCGWSDEA